MTELPKIQRDVPLAPWTTLKAGGPAERFAVAQTVDELAELCDFAYRSSMRMTVLGWGSNVLPSDAGVPGLVVVNAAARIESAPDGAIVADGGVGLQDLFIYSAQRSLTGLEFAVGIPGTLAGALVSNAGAYRSSIGGLVRRIELAMEGRRLWVGADWMRFSYRDSVLRKPDPPQAAILRVEIALGHGDPWRIYGDAREFQRQRIGKQPPQASAGSFFKNVEDAGLARSLPSLPSGLREAGVVPAGYLIEAAGLAGTRLGGAMISRRHANFLLNVGSATAGDLRRLARRARKAVSDRFGANLEEEVLYLGDWSGFDESSDP